MRRRDFLTLAGAAAAFPRVAIAQQSQRRLPRVAIITNAPIVDLRSAAEAAAVSQGVAVFLSEMTRLGFVEGQTVTYEPYSSPGPDYGPIARTVAASKPDLIFINGGSATALALMGLTSTIPIVAGTADAIGSGLVSTLAPTRRNLAVVSGTASSDYTGKNLSLLAEAAPSARRPAYMNTGTQGQSGSSDQVRIRSASDAAGKLGLSLSVIIVDLVGDELAFRKGFTEAMTVKVDMVLFGRNPQVNTGSALLARLALENRLPGISDYHPFARSGGLLSHGQRDGDQYKKVAQYAAMVLNGADPGSLPVLQPDVFDLVVNLKTAKALGLTVPQSLLTQATEVIE